MVGHNTKQTERTVKVSIIFNSCQYIIFNFLLNTVRDEVLSIISKELQMFGLGTQYYIYHNLFMVLKYCMTITPKIMLCYDHALDSHVEKNYQKLKEAGTLLAILFHIH